ncbi:MAG: hypothetical protein DRJ03_27675 [Chloroflexi bacterium]|nr:MAG: hypothetical protein DRJ03_27675 [Chloroflexota bacterium]
MFLNTTHEEYDADMEALCSLPRSPWSVPLKLLREDMGCKRNADLNLKELGKRFGVETHRSEDHAGLVASIPSSRWAEAQSACEDYWKRVYPND